MIIKRIAPLALLLGGGAVLGGCTPNDISIGAAVRNNNEAQIVEPDPKYAENQATDGAQVAGAQDRYRKGTVKKPKSIKTTSGSSGGSSGGSN
jgi:hypothetical protein